ncbi:V-type ATP synthase subunit D [Chitinispirillales bacterium ANBcel5]|uniref:V-type ATP synthase subunit D n=1 Tax=Cellulosispirillum alkaliphilum TaxID=3039283 RepID=UPI002A56ABFA|nr:V-type ATP synthase subunit D [Chitinispirillales bacterium ANBcel5]
MALKFQYNKTFLQQLNKELKIRENALPTLIAKESALRLEVKKAKEQVAEYEKKVEEMLASISQTYRLWNEMPGELISIKDVNIDIKKIAGVKTPVLNDVEFDVRRYSLISNAAWVPQGLELIKNIAEVKIGLELGKKKVSILEYARKKTTQKVNLYEKVQIPEYNEAIRRIKRFLEDDENLSKSSQKILKAKIAMAEAA